MEETTIKLRSGETIVLKKTIDGPLCPVCGFGLKGDLPYDWAQEIDVQGNAIGSKFGAASFDTCPCCNTEYGVDDDSDTKQVKDMWDKLRLAWLSKSNWSETAITQIENLGISRASILPT